MTTPIRLAIMCALMAALFIDEMIGVIDPSYPTISAIVRAYVAWKWRCVLVLGVSVFLIVHFLLGAKNMAPSPLNIR